MKEQRVLALLGTGYTGRYLFKLASQVYFVPAGSRDPDRRLTDIPHPNRTHFDLARPATWRNIPHEADLIWCFPAAPLEKVRALMKALAGSPRRIVVLGSTSAYEAGDMREYPPAWIDESAPVDFTKARVKGEEYLRKEYGAILLRVAGIYGPGRNPLDWIRQGRVGPTRKYVNLIHVEDLAAICLEALEKGRAGEVYNVSDGTPRTWEEICETARARWGIRPPQAQKDDRAGKRILTAKLRQELGYEVRRKDLYAAIEEIEPPQV